MRVTRPAPGYFSLTRLPSFVARPGPLEVGVGLAQLTEAWEGIAENYRTIRLISILPLPLSASSEGGKFHFSPGHPIEPLIFLYFLPQILPPARTAARSGGFRPNSVHLGARIRADYKLRTARRRRVLVEAPAAPSPRASKSSLASPREERPKIRSRRCGDGAGLWPRRPAPPAEGGRPHRARRRRAGQGPRPVQGARIHSIPSAAICWSRFGPASMPPSVQWRDRDRRSRWPSVVRAWTLWFARSY
jgi:hypothetical protein